MTQCINYYNNFNYSNIINFLSYIACNFNSYEDTVYLNYEYEKYNKFNIFNINNINNINNIANINNIYNKLDLLVINYPNFFNFILTSFIIIIGNKLLVLMFGVNARWFQLHSLINFLVSIHIFKDYLKIIIDPANGYLVLNDHYVSYLIINLHLFHLITFRNLGFYDYFHHILFVAFGVLPTIFFIQTNQCYLAYIPCSGIPGTIEYFILSLYKNNKISLVTQKYINSINYNYFRFPLCIIGVTYNYINYNNGNLNDNYYMTLYTNILLFLNGSLFNYLTLESYFEKKLKIK
jgi:hypothetical protein